jgi:hypothetical protein
LSIVLRGSNTTINLPYMGLTLKNIPNKMEAELGGTILGFKWRYNSRSNSFTLDVMNQVGKKLMAGRKVVSGWNNLASVMPGKLPKGLAMIPVDPSGIINKLAFETFDKMKCFLGFCSVCKNGVKSTSRDSQMLVE